MPPPPVTWSALGRSRHLRLSPPVSPHRLRSARSTSPTTEPMAPPVAGYTAWYDATLITGVSDGAKIATWNDSSGNGHHLVSQYSSANQPVYYSTTGTRLINGHPAVWFNVANTGGLTCTDTFSIPHPFTIVAVSQASSLSGAPVLWCVNTGSTSQYQIVPTT